MLPAELKKLEKKRILKVKPGTHGFPKQILAHLVEPSEYTKIYFGF